MASFGIGSREGRHGRCFASARGGLEVEGGGQQGAGVVGLRALEDAAARRRLSTTSPFCMTTTLWASARTTRRSWRDEEVGEAVLRLQPAQELDDLHLHGHVEGARSARRGRRASAAGSWRGRWRCAGAGRRRTRAGSGRRSRGRGRPPRGSRRRGRVLVAEAVHGEALGDDLRDRHARARASRRGPGRPSACRGAAAQLARASSPGCPGRGRRCGPREEMSRMMARASVVLPEPRLADDAEGLAGADARRWRR